jgi:RHS repeat-associated protein
MTVTRYTVVNGSIVSENRGGVIRDYLPNPLGNTLALLDNTQTQTDRWSYLPFGESTRIKGTNPTAMLFVGAKSCRQDSTGTKSLMGRRVLDLQKARWMTQDPIGFAGGDQNLYRYVGANPTSRVDPSGLYTITKPGSPCASGTIAITPGNGDRTRIVVGPGGTLIPRSGVFGPGDQGCIAANGGFFEPGPRGTYPPGFPTQPWGPVKDCNGKTFPGNPLPPRITPIRVGTGGGYTTGRNFGTPGSVQLGPTARTGVCINKAGQVVGIIVTPMKPGMSLGAFGKCMSGACPPGCTPVLLDGGNSTQLITGPPASPYKGFGGAGRAVHNWIVICPPGGGGTPTAR